ncbi:ABC transporter ATP-binding protein [Roseiterribacter gracilis]|uniref:ABC transporter ATP-binding protein n=1 Tax=Roseiterribacter gracilis TaxID=2812848 RepID=A0A8S8X8F3_9PROT|nr:ABC transporter ATP-binding protein [Rhodospirillales bacterium TMPK1]
MTLLQVRNLSVDYATEDGVVHAARDISFDIAPGEVLGLAGESGSGKSTVAFAIARLHRPPAFISDGSVTLDGTDVLQLDGEALRAWRWREVAVVLQSAMNALNPLLRVADQFRDMFQAHGIHDRKEIRARSADLLNMVGIDPARLDDYPHRFSGGMRQRIVIAMALALSPKLLIMDEPTTALDVVVQRELLEEVADLRSKLGFAVLFITHDLALMSQFCDRIGIMLRGELVELGTPTQMVAAPRHPYTRALWNAIPPLHPPSYPLEGPLRPQGGQVQRQ